MADRSVFGASRCLFPSNTRTTGAQCIPDLAAELPLDDTYHSWVPRIQLLHAYIYAHIGDLPAMVSSPKPSSPPPAYTEIDQGQSSEVSRMDNNGPFPSASFPEHSGYGPTNIIQQQANLLPYYDPRSPYALAEASSRARWRFILAFCWAVLIIATLSILMGAELDIQKNPWNGDYLRRVVFGNADSWSSS